nr:glycine-rich RNA-binding protein 3, mitochondrial-like [Tanacetum cinerariifolium]
MALVNKVGSLIKQTASKHIHNELSASNSSIFQIIRCMSSSELLVEGLSHATTNTSLKKAFVPYGDVREALVSVASKNAGSSRFGLVIYSNTKSASAAIKALDQKELHGRVDCDVARHNVGGSDKRKCGDKDGGESHNSGVTSGNKNANEDYGDLSCGYFHGESHNSDSAGGDRNASEDYGHHGSGYFDGEIQNSDPAGESKDSFFSGWGGGDDSKGLVYPRFFWTKDTTKSTYLVNRSPSSGTRFKKSIDMLGFFGWPASIKQGILEPVYVKCIFLGYHKSIVGNKLWRYRSVQVLQGVEFEVKPQEDHKFKVEPYRNVDHVVDSHEVQTQDLIYYYPTRDREQYSACELFSYREDFEVAAVEKIYAHELLTFNDTVAYDALNPNCRVQESNDVNNDTIDEYAAKLSGIASKSATLEEVTLKHKLLKKFLTNRPRWFVHIVAPLEQVTDLETTRFKDVVERLKAGDRFAVAAVEKIYAHELLTFNDTVAYDVISKWKARLKEDMDVRSYVKGKCTWYGDHQGLEWQYSKGVTVKSVVAKHLGVAGIQQQNRLVDETNVTLFAKVRCFLIQSGLSKVFWAEDTTRYTYLVNRSPSSAIGFKKPIDMLGFFSWLASIKQEMLEPVKVKCIFLRYHKSLVGYKLRRLDDITSKVVHYRNMGFNESGKYKKTFIGSGVGTGSMHVLHGFEFEVEPLGDHTSEVEPHENVDQGAGLQEVQTQDLTDYQLARDREQHLACEL